MTVVATASFEVGGGEGKKLHLSTTEDVLPPWGEKEGEKMYPCGV